MWSKIDKHVFSMINLLILLELPVNEINSIIVRTINAKYKNCANSDDINTPAKPKRLFFQSLPNVYSLLMFNIYQKQSNQSAK